MKTWKVIVWNSLVLVEFLIGFIARDWVFIGFGSAMLLVFIISYILNKK